MVAASVIDSMWWISGFFIASTLTPVIITSGNIGLKNPNYPFGCSLKHNLAARGRHGTTMIWWDSVGAWAIETFGLPGDKFITEIHHEFMVFWFCTEEDAMLFMLRFGQANFITFDHSSS